MKLSIVTPSYNSSLYIQRTLETIHNQGIDNIEHILVDGASTDQTVSIAQKFPLSKIISEKDNGQSDALNKGLSIVTGDIIAWQNADDEYTEGTLKKVLEYFEKNPGIDLVYGSYEMIDSAGNHVCTVTPPEFNLKSFANGRFCFVQPTVFWRRRVQDSVGHLSTALNFCMDVDFYCRVIQSGYKVGRISATLGRFRTHDDSKTQNPMNKFKHKMEYKAVLKSHFGDSHYNAVLFEFFYYRAQLASWINRKIVKRR